MPAIGADYTTAIDPRIPLVEQARAAEGAVTTWRSLGGRWAVPGTRYGEGIERHWQAMRAESAGGGTPPQGGRPVEKPPITISHTPHKFGGYANGTRRVRMICNHVTAPRQGALSDHGSLSWLRDPHPGPDGNETSPSCSYLIARSGKIFEIVPPHKAAWANGIDYDAFPNGPRSNRRNPIIDEAIRGRISPNQWTISIEHEAYNGNGITETQWDATIKLQAWLCQTFRLTPDRVHIITHSEIDGINRPHCTGWTEAHWDRLMGGIHAYYARPARRRRRRSTRAPS